MQKPKNCDALIKRDPNGTDHLWGMDLSIDKNQLIIVKTDEIGLVWFLLFIKNQSVIILKIQILRNFEKQKSSDKSRKTGQCTVFIQNLNFE
jgi:hypothetical protein